MSDTPRFRFPTALRKRRIFTLRKKMLLKFGGMFTLLYALGLLAHLYGIPYTDFGGEYGTQQEEVFQKLNLVADLKKARIQRWILERKADMFVMVGDRHLAGGVASLLEDIGQMRTQGITEKTLWAEVQRLDVLQNITGKLTRIKSSYPEYESVSIVEWSTLSVIASSHEYELGEDHSHSFRADSQQILYGNDVYMSDIAADDLSGIPALHLSGTIRMHGPGSASPGKVIALLIIEIDPDEIIRPLLHTGGGLGRTGEVLLVNRQHKLLTNLKHSLADGSEAKPLNYSVETAPALQASQGRRRADYIPRLPRRTGSGRLSPYQSFIGSFLGNGR